VRMTSLAKRQKFCDVWCYAFAAGAKKTCPFYGNPDRICVQHSAPLEFQRNKKGDR
jgi:hypothetical protein